jgi:hypothetical protein
MPLDFKSGSERLGVRTVIIKNYKRAVNFFSFEPQTLKFKFLARRNRVKVLNPHGVVLVESRYWADQYLALIAFLPSALKFYNSTAITYEMLPQRCEFSFKKYIKHKFSAMNAIARSKFLLVGADPQVRPHHLGIIQSITDGKYSKRDFENFSYRGILIGDLIYDHYLRKARKLTLDFNDPSLAFHTSEFLQYCDYFLDYFMENKVNAVICSHPVYYFGIPARVAVSKGIDAYLVDNRRATKINETNPFPYTSQWKNLRSHFNSFNESSKEKALEVGQSRLKKRISGDKEDLGGEWRTKHSHPWMFNVEDLKDRPSVLIALHDFIDSCHRYGTGFYPDFYEWLLDLAEMSKNSKLNWLVKPHPWALRDVSEKLLEIVSKFPHLKVIPPETDNQELVRRGLKYCLTVHGHIAHELPFLDVIVINASIQNPHEDFQFSLTPSSLSEYREKINNLESVHFDPNKESLFEFYFMNYVFNLQSWSIPHYPSFLKDIGTRREPKSEKVYDWYFSEKNKFSLNCLRQVVLNYLNSDELVLGRVHFSTVKCSNLLICECLNVGKFESMI